MIIYGAGGHARVVISCLRTNREPVRVIFDDDDSKTSLSGIIVTGSYDSYLFPDDLLVIAIGNNETRRLISHKVIHRFGQVFHPSALIENDVAIGPGTVVLHGAIIQSGSILGKHVIINTAAKIDHQCSLSDYVHIAPGAILCGNVSVGENTLIGAGSIIVPNIKVGKNCIVAAGSVITKNIPDGQIVRGNPGRIIKAFK